MSNIGGERRGWMRWTAWALCLLPLGALADQPGGAGFPLAAAGDQTLPSVDGGSPNGPAGRLGRHQPTDQEWQEASAVLQQYSPKRMALVSQLPDGRDKQRLRSLLFARYQACRRLQDVSQKVYLLQLQRLTIEDNVFDIHRQFLAATGPKKAALKTELGQQVQDLFDNVQQDRLERVNRMKAWAAELQTKYDDDKRNREAVISAEVRDVIRSGPNALWRDNAQRLNGAGPAAPDETSENFHPTPTTNPQP